VGGWYQWRISDGGESFYSRVAGPAVFRYHLDAAISLTRRQQPTALSGNDTG